MQVCRETHVSKNNIFAHQRFRIIGISSPKWSMVELFLLTTNSHSAKFYTQLVTVSTCTIHRLWSLAMIGQKSWLGYTRGPWFYNNRSPTMTLLRIVFVGSKSIFSIVNPLQLIQYRLLTLKSSSFALQRIGVAARVGSAGLLHAHSECIKLRWRRRMRACRWDFVNLMRSWQSGFWGWWF